MNIDKVLGRLSRSGSVVDEDVRSLFFGDYINPSGDKNYDEITDLKELTQVMEQCVYYLVCSGVTYIKYLDKPCLIICATLFNRTCEMHM